jgi:ankyrin repeat protein
MQFTTNMAFSPTLGIDTGQPREEENLRMQAAAVSKQETTSDSVNVDNADSMMRVEGFPHVGPHFSNFNIPIVLSQTKPRNYLRPANLARFIQADIAPATPNQPPRQMCCVNRCRGDPRADKCLFCLFDIPEAHFFVPSLVDQWRAGRDIVSTFAARPVAIDFGEVDDFGDTVLHLASSLGAGSVILSWFISMGVNVHAKNAAGQTFMHVLDIRGLWHWHNSDFSRVEADECDLVLLLNVLRGMDFDFNARDDYGQTPMHVLAKDWLPVHIIQTAFEAGMVGGSMLFNNGFQERSVESLIQAQADVDHTSLLVPRREMMVDNLLYLMKPIADIPPQQNKKMPLPDQTPQEAAHPHTGLRKIIDKTISGFPDTKYRGRNGLHCLAESCISLRLESSNRDTAAPQLKRKRQAETTLRHEYTVNTVKELLKVGVDPNDYDKRGNTPLMAFIQNRLSPNFERKITADVLQILIDGGASVHRRSRKGETALHIAMRLGRPSAVEVLLNNYANVHARAKNGEGILAAAGKASLRAKEDGALYHRIITCIAIAGKYGAILGPSTKDEWDRQITCVNKEGPVMIESPRDGNNGMNNVQ